MVAGDALFARPLLAGAPSAAAVMVFHCEKVHESAEWERRGWNREPPSSATASAFPASSPHPTGRMGGQSLLFVDILFLGAGGVGRERSSLGHHKNCSRPAMTQFTVFMRVPMSFSALVASSPM